MATVVHFVGADEPVMLEDGYEKVNSTLMANDSGQFILASGGRVTIYKSGVAYIDEASEQEPLVRSL